MHFRGSFLVAVCGAAALACFFMRPCAADTILFSVSGINGTAPSNIVSGTAEFSIDGMDLIVTLTNTSEALGTNADVLTGVLFTPSISTLSLTKVEVLEGSVWSDKSTDAEVGVEVPSPEDWTGSWTDAFGVAPPPAGTVGAATTGFGGLFAASGITVGTGSANYGIVSHGTYPQGGGATGNPNQFPLADDSLVLTFTSAGSLDGLAISGVHLLFGTSGEGTVPEETVPEPSALLLALASGVGLLQMVRCRQRDKKETDRM